MSEGKSPTTTTRPCWIDLPWNGWVWVNGNSPEEAIAKAEVDRQRKIEDLQERIEHIRAMPLEVKFPEGT